MSTAPTLTTEKHTQVMREVRGVPQSPIQCQWLAQRINHEDGPEDRNGLLPVSQRIGQRRGLGRVRCTLSFFHERSCHLFLPVSECVYVWSVCVCVCVCGRRYRGRSGHGVLAHQERVNNSETMQEVIANRDHSRQADSLFRFFFSSSFTVMLKP